MQTTVDLDTRLGAAGYRLTGPRRALASIVAERDGHFRAADLIADPRVAGLGVGRATLVRRPPAPAGGGLAPQMPTMPASAASPPRSSAGRATPSTGTVSSCSASARPARSGDREKVRRGARGGRPAGGRAR